MGSSDSDPAGTPAGQARRVYPERSFLSKRIQGFTLEMTPKLLVTITKLDSRTKLVDKPVSKRAGKAPIARCDAGFRPSGHFFVT